MYPHLCQWAICHGWHSQDSSAWSLRITTVSGMFPVDSMYRTCYRSEDYIYHCVSDSVSHLLEWVSEWVYQLKCLKYIVVLMVHWPITTYICHLTWVALTMAESTTHMGVRVGMADNRVRRVNKPLEPQLGAVEPREQGHRCGGWRSVWAGSAPVHQVVHQGLGKIYHVGIGWHFRLPNIRPY